MNNETYETILVALVSQCSANVSLCAKNRVDCSLIKIYLFVYVCCVVAAQRFSIKLIIDYTHKIIKTHALYSFLVN